MQEIGESQFINDNVGLKNALKKIIEICENDYLCEKLIGNKNYPYQKCECVYCYELRYKNIDIYLYANDFSLYVDNFSLKDLYLKSKLIDFENDELVLFNLPISPNKGGFSINQVGYSDNNLQSLLELISHVL